MVHIVMFGVDAVSHTLPSLEILGELVRRGHRLEVVNDPAQRDLAGVPPRALALVPRAMQPHADRVELHRPAGLLQGVRHGLRRSSGLAPRPPGRTAHRPRRDR
nr:hypothetical protein [Janibacter hoylei]